MLIILIHKRCLCYKINENTSVYFGIQRKSYINGFGNSGTLLLMDEWKRG